MRRPMVPVTAWTCLLLVCLLPAQSMHNFQEAENLGRLASTPHPPTDFTPVGHDASDLNGHPPPFNREREAEEPIPHLNELTTKLLGRIDVPKFLHKIYDVMTRGFIHLDRPMGKTVRAPYYASWKRTSEWEEMDKDITEMPLPEEPGAAKFELQPEEPPMDLIFTARNELEKLNGKTAIFQTRSKERQILLVKTLYILSRKPAYRESAIHAIETVVKTLQLRKNPEDLPKIMPYIKAAHYLMTTPKKPLDSPGLLAQRLLKSDELGPSLQNILEKQDLKSWLGFFATEQHGEVQEKYKSMLESKLGERFNEILRWSSEVLHPANTHRYSTDEVLFALETLYVHSVQKPEGLGSHNPAFEKLIDARDAWRGHSQLDESVPAAIELTANSAIKKKATIVENNELLYILHQHKQQFTPQEIH
ncbi:hypothetical protein VP01_1260g4 [Puccinia sorghi]|uniref:Uncharacterized protein n=1 Tax=Puccinia sorghi TaxID=27349 RepID=A0A0L6VPG9_9BASI|nr:hypothetical protein VP01_1260g4 [Puccinia sorghi]